VKPIRQRKSVRPALICGLLYGALLAAPPAAQAGSTAYTYDALGRVVGVTYANGAAITYAYDAAGNRTAVVGASAPAAVWLAFNWAAANWASAATGQAPVANALTATVPYDAPYTNIPLNITGGTATSVTVPTAPASGSTSIGGIQISYKPNVGFSGADQFTYKAANAYGSSAAATVLISVGAPVAPSATIGAGANASGNASGYSFPANSGVIVTGGSGSYTYLWSNTNDGNGVWTTGGASTTFAPAVSGVTLATGCISTAKYSVTVTDTVSHLNATSNTASYTWTNTGSACRS